MAEIGEFAMISKNSLTDIVSSSRIKVLLLMARQYLISYQPPRSETVKTFCIKRNKTGSNDMFLNSKCKGINIYYINFVSLHIHSVYTLIAWIVGLKMVNYRRESEFIEVGKRERVGDYAS